MAESPRSSSEKLEKDPGPGLVVERSKNEHAPAPAPAPYTAFSTHRKNFIIFVVTAAGFFGPLSGGIYLPALNELEDAFDVSDTAINVTVSVFMLVFAIGVSYPFIPPSVAACGSSMYRITFC